MRKQREETWHYFQGGNQLRVPYGTDANSSEKVKLWYLSKETEIVEIKAKKDEKAVFFPIEKPEELVKRKTIVMRKRRGKEQWIRRAKKLKNIICLKGESM